MKKLLKIVLGVLLFSIFVVSSIYGQERTNFSVHRNLKFYRDSEVKGVKFEVNEKNCRFNLSINSSVKGGNIKIEIIDPNNKKRGDFSVGCLATLKAEEIKVDLDKKKSKSKVTCKEKKKYYETVTGSINKSIENPTNGVWTIRVIPQNAVGNVTISYVQETTSETRTNKQ